MSRMPVDGSRQSQGWCAESAQRAVPGAAPFRIEGAAPVGCPGAALHDGAHGHGAVDVVVTGHVQGVFFRAAMREQAERHGSPAGSSNEPDGSVRAHLEGAGRGRRRAGRLVRAGLLRRPGSRTSDARTARLTGAALLRQSDSPKNSICPIYIQRSGIDVVSVSDVGPSGSARLGRETHMNFKNRGIRGSTRRRGRRSRRRIRPGRRWRRRRRARARPRAPSSRRSSESD